MNTEVKRCFDAKFDIFDQYFDVPEDVSSELAQLKSETFSLAESCESGLEFEEKFVSQNLIERYNGFFVRCIPKKGASMTSAEKKASVKMAAEMSYGSSDAKTVVAGLTKDILKDATEIATTELQGKAISMNRERMIEEGTFDEYTRTGNKINDAARGFHFLKDKLRKK